MVPVFPSSVRSSVDHTRLLPSPASHAADWAPGPLFRKWPPISHAKLNVLKPCFHIFTSIAAVRLFATAVFAEPLDPEIAATLRTHCLKCHGPQKAEARLRVNDLTADLAERGNALNWIEIRNAINLGEMPPEGEEPLPVEMIRRMSSGGAWACAPAAVRSSIRTFAEASDAAVYTGFRVVRELR